jgi:hypothetical protein
MKKILIDYYNTDTKNNVLGVFDANDDRIGDKNHTNIIGEAKKTKERIIAPNGYPAIVYVCNDIKYLVFSDMSANKK